MVTFIDLLNNEIKTLEREIETLDNDKYPRITKRISQLLTRLKTEKDNITKT